MLLIQSYFVILSSTFVIRIYEILSFVFVFSASDKMPHVRIFLDCYDFKEINPEISDIIFQNRSSMYQIADRNGNEGSV